MEEKKTVLSAIQPTGQVHIGNYFGAVKNWVELQKKYKCFYGVVDYHAMTMPYQPKKLRENTWDLIINLMAMGVEAENLFIQSLVPEHTELSWIFNCFCSYGQLTRMTQFKDKSKDSGEKSEDGFISAGLLNYPILQAADILIYRADFVPVGKDQEQHLELSRNIAQRFNNQIGKEYFILPETLFTKTAKVMSTADPTRKMSKSAGDKHFISVFAEPAKVLKQIRSAVTDTGEDSQKMSPGVENLFSILDACEAQDKHSILLKKFESGTLQYSELKSEVGESLVSVLVPIQERKKELLANKKEVKYQVKNSSAEIRKRAQQTVREVKELAGLSNVKI